MGPKGSACRTRGPVDPSLTIPRLLREGTDRLRGVGLEAPRLECDLLLAHALGCERIDLYAHDDRPLAPDEVARFQELVSRRLRGEPVAYLVGVREFWSLSFRIRPGVLVPRPETETVVEVCLGLIQGLDRAVVADMGTGSGAIILSIRSEARGTELELHASDIDARALALARENEARQGAGPAVRWWLGGGLSPFVRAGLSGRLDLLVSNPPYLCSSEAELVWPRGVLEHEPRHALFAPDDDPLHFYRLFAAEAPSLLRPGGHLVVEVGCGRSDAVRRLLASGGRLKPVAVARDLSGIDRAIVMKAL